MRLLLLIAVLPVIALAAPPSVTLTRGPTATPGTYKVDWTATGAASCTASSTPTIAAWNGAMAVSGTLNLPLAPNQLLALTCVTAGVTSVTLNWTAPTQNTDGSPLTNLSGFTIYKGQTSGSLTQDSVVNSATTSTKTITGLAPGTWFFALDAFDATGTHSVITNEASKALAATESATQSVKVTVPNPPTGLTAN